MDNKIILKYHILENVLFFKCVAIYTTIMQKKGDLPNGKASYISVKLQNISSSPKS